jgi:hypothetical protein
VPQAGQPAAQYFLVTNRRSAVFFRMRQIMNGADIGLTSWQSDEAKAQLDFEQAFAAHHRLVYRYAWESHGKPRSRKK